MQAYMRKTLGVVEHDAAAGRGHSIGDHE